MARRPRQIAHKAEIIASNASAPSATEATPGIDTHIQATTESGATFTSGNGVAETVSSPTNQMSVVTKSGNTFTSS